MFPTDTGESDDITSGAIRYEGKEITRWSPRRLLEAGAVAAAAIAAERLA